MVRRLFTRFSQGMRKPQSYPRVAPGGNESRLPFPLPGTGGRAQACAERLTRATHRASDTSVPSARQPENHQRKGARGAKSLTSLSLISPA